MTAREVIAAMYLRVLDRSPMIAERQIGLENADAFIGELERHGFRIIRYRLVGGESVDNRTEGGKDE